MQAPSVTPSSPSAAAPTPAAPPVNRLLHVPTFELGDWKVDFVARRVFVGGAEVHLTPTEYRLLQALIRHVGKVLTHRQLLRELNADEHGDAQHTLRVHISSLRRKMEAEPARPRHLITEPGVGYRLREEG